MQLYIFQNIDIYFLIKIKFDDYFYEISKHTLFRIDYSTLTYCNVQQMLSESHLLLILFHHKRIVIELTT